MRKVGGSGQSQSVPDITTECQLTILIIMSRPLWKGFPNPPPLIIMSRQLWEGGYSREYIYNQTESTLRLGHAQKFVFGLGSRDFFYGLRMTSGYYFIVYDIVLLQLSGLPHILPLAMQPDFRHLPDTQGYFRASI